VDSNDQSRAVRRVTYVGLGVNLLLAGIKFAGGVLGRSQAVVADAVHSLSDMTTDIAIVVGSHYWGRPPDKVHPHGHRRIETLITLSIGVALLLVACGMLLQAVRSLSRGVGGYVPGNVALAAAAISVLVKEWLYRWTVKAGRGLKSMPILANAWHHRSDALSSLPVVLAVGVCRLSPRLAYLDQVGAILVSVFVFHAAAKVTLPALGKLVDAGAPEKTRREIERVVLDTERVQRTHRIRTRYVGCCSLAVDLHIEVEGEMSVRDGHDISELVKHRLMAANDEIVDVVVHLEPVG